MIALTENDEFKNYKKGVIFFVLFLLTYTGSVFAQKPELIIPSGQNSWITAFKISQDRKFMVSAAMDKSIKIYDLSQKREVFTFWEHKKSANAIDIALDNRTVVSGDDNGQIIVWDLYSGKVKYHCNEENGNDITSIAIAPDGKTFLAGDRFGYISEYNLLTGKLNIEERYHFAPINKIRYISNGSEFFASAPDDNVKDTLSDFSRTRVSDKKSLDYIYWSSAQFCSAVFSEQDNSLYHVVTNPSEIRIKRQNEEVIKIPIIDYDPLDIEIIDEKRLLIAARKNEKISFLIFNTLNFKIEKVINTDFFFRKYFPIAGFKMELVLNTSQVLFTTGWEQKITELNYETGSIIDFIPKRTNFQTPMVMGDQLILAGEDKKIKKWNLENNAITHLYSSTNNLHQILSTKENVIIRETSTMVLWNKDLSKIKDSINVGQNNYGIYVSPDSTKIFINKFKKEIEIYSLPNCSKKILLLKGDPNTENKIGWFSENIIFYFSTINNNRCLVYTDGEKYERIVPIINSEKFPNYISEIAANRANNSVIFAYDGKVSMVNEEGQIIKENKISEGLCYMLKFEPKLKQIMASFEDGEILFLNPFTLEIEKSLKGHKGWATEIAFTEDYQKVYTTSYDNTIKIWDYKKGSLISTLSLINSKEWVVVNEDGLFDASPQAMKDIYYVVNEPSDGDEPWKIIELGQLKHRYYQPDLLQIQLGYKLEKLRTPLTLTEVPLAPKVTTLIKDNQLQITLKNQKGGIGKVAIFINNAEVIADARPNGKADANKTDLRIVIDLNNFRNRYSNKEEIEIKVIAWNNEEWISSKPTISTYIPLTSKGSVANTTSDKKNNEMPKLFGLVVGTSDYTGQMIDLRYAAKDAEDFTTALQASSENLFGKKNSFVELLSSGNENGNKKPSRDNVLNKLKYLEANVKPTDIVIVYLSGHGINFGGPEGDFYYLTQEASGADPAYLNDEAIRNSATISSTELSQLLNRITARKKILILDACASGKAAEKMVTTKDVPASQIRALDRMQDRTGFYILAGSAADAVSYESSVYGQGLLTYSLLKAMKGSALRIDAGEEYIDVQQLFQFAVDEVPNLSKNIGGIQKPFFKSPDNQQSFDIGKVDTKTKNAIVISEPKPVFIEAVFSNPESLYDDLGLSENFNAYLQDNAAKGKNSDIAFMRVKEYPGSYKISGTYTWNDKNIHLKCRIISDKKTVGDIIAVDIAKAEDITIAIKTIMSQVIKNYISLK